MVINLTIINICIVFSDFGLLSISTVLTESWFLCHNHKPMTHHQWSWCPGSWGQRLCSSGNLAKLPHGVDSALLLAASA